MLGYSEAHAAEVWLKIRRFVPFKVHRKENAELKSQGGAQLHSAWASSISIKVVWPS